MENTLTIKVGQMPGTITEVAVNAGTTVEEVLSLASLEVQEGFEIRYNGDTVSKDDVVNESGTLLLTKMVKGNAELKVGTLPGVLTSVAVEDGATIADVLELASLDASGYTIRYNGEDVTQETTVDADGTVLLVKQIKGNAEIKVGTLPGVLQNLMVEDGTTIAEALEMANINPNGYTVRYNGEDVDTDAKLYDDGTVLLVKQIKGNK